MFNQINRLRKPFFFLGLLVYLLFEAGITVSLENPLKIKNFSRAMLCVTKTDKMDARLIALYGEKIPPAPYRLRSDVILTLKQKRTVIRQLKRQLIATRNLKGSMKVLPFLDPQCKNSIDKTREFLDKQMEPLTSIKGIGATLIAAFIISNDGFTYFDNTKQPSRYLGLSPIYM